MAEWDWAPYVVGGAGRPDSFSGMNPAFNSSLQQLFAAAPPEIQQKLRITSGYRSPERQKQLFADAVAKYGSESAARKWVAPPGNSKHNHGVAADLKYLGPEAITWAHQNAEKFGLHFPLSNENWHIEPIGSRGGRTAPAAIPAQVQVASAAPAVAGTNAAPVAADPSVASFFGDIVAPTAAPDFGSVVASYLAQRQRRDEQAEADQIRRNALLSQPSPFG